MTAQNPGAAYICINSAPAAVPVEIRDRALCIRGDIGETLAVLNCRERPKKTQGRGVQAG